jgi:hypothetical protein
MDEAVSRVVKAKTARKWSEEKEDWHRWRCGFWRR